MNNDTETTLPEPPPKRGGPMSSLRFRFVAGFLVSFLILIAAITFLVLGQVRPMLIEKNVELVESTGSGMVVDLGRSMLMAEALTHSLARAAETLEPDAALFEELVPKLMDLDGMENMIAGGGVWPEPYEFDGKTERRAFFFGRDADGTLRYYDDYNNPLGNGYHREEWYVPASMIQRPGCFWSRSYMDPHTREPMVTCTIRYERAGEFAGVATLDLRLSGLADFFASQAKSTGGYAFAVDRNNTILSFPDWDMATRQGNEFGPAEFIHVNDLAKTHKAFRPIAEALHDINKSVIGKKTITDDISTLAAHMDAVSPQIRYTEAELIEALYSAPAGQGLPRQAQMVRLQLDNDYFLGAAATVSIFEVPGAFWKVVLITPNNSVVQTAQADAFSMMLKLIAISLIAMLAWYLVLDMSLIKPIRAMSARIRRSSSLDTDDLGAFNNTRNDELGDLFGSIVTRTRALNENRRELHNEIEVRRKAELEANEAREQAENACKLQGEFIANMSHEIRTPLNGILGMAQLLVSGGLKGKHKEYAGIILSSGKSLLSIINDVLDISKVEAGLLELEERPFDSQTLIEQSVDAVTGVAIQKNLDISWQIDDDCQGSYLGDARRIKQVLINLLGNAVKFTDKGSVTLRVSSPDQDMLRFAVSDTGPGIPENEVGTIFERFRQADGSGARKHGGTGLGLSISQELVRAMKGEIKLTTEVDKGSTFWFDLPLEQTDAVACPPPSASHSGHASVDDGKPFSLLLVEDNPINRMVVIAALQDSGVDISTAENGAEAIEFLQECEFDLVLMDVQMPVLPGDEAVRRIRAGQSLNTDVPIIMLTANAMNGDREKYLAIGANDYLTKPLDFEQLKDMISRYRNLPSAGSEMASEAVK